MGVMESTSVGAEIVKRIAGRDGVDPVDLDETLYDVIDADALETLTNGTDGRHPQATLRVTFSYCGYTVTVNGSGQVRITEQPLAAEPDGSARGAAGDD